MRAAKPRTERMNSPGRSSARTSTGPINPLPAIQLNLAYRVSSPASSTSCVPVT
jgi:hypothetical protein